MSILNTSVLCEAATLPNRINEDACYFTTDSHITTAAVIDGAGQREPFSAWDQLIVDANLPPGATTATYVAQLTKAFYRDNPYLSPADLIAGANRHLRQQMEAVVPIEAEAFAKREPRHKATFNEEPRYIRLMLPVCVTTVAQVMADTNRVAYAHVGDTALLVHYRSGEVHRLTTDQMGQHDSAALRLALDVQREMGAAHVADVLGTERVRDANRRNGIYHNYVDEHGNTDKSVGVGAVNGLLTLGDYIEAGEFPLDDVASLLLCSDGFLLPTDLAAPDDQTDLAAIFDQINTVGLRGYYNALRATEREDTNLDRYPRFKLHDDVTAIFMAFSE